MTPAEVSYNRLYVIGDYSKISWMAQVEMNSSQEMANHYDALKRFVERLCIHGYIERHPRLTSIG